MIYDIEMEFPKIVDAFERVKYDVTFLYDTLARQERMLKAQNTLIAELTETVSKFTKTKVKTVQTIVPKTITKTVTKKVGEKVSVVGNSLSKKAHKETCPYAQNIKKENFVKFKNQNDAFKKGYSACQCMKGKAKGKK